MERKKIILIFEVILLMGIIGVNLVHAEMLTNNASVNYDSEINNETVNCTDGICISKVGVIYESRILDELNRIKGTNETFVKVIIFLKNTSQTDDFLSVFSSNEFKDIINRQGSDRIGIKITDGGFYKLIQDERINKIYFSRKGYFINDTINMNILILGIIFILIVIILFYWIFLRSKKKISKK